MPRRSPKKHHHFDKHILDTAERMVRVIGFDDFR
jgi:hypothetical protein